MSAVEDAIAAAVAANVAPLASEVRRLADELATLRRTLPAPTGTIEDAARVWGLSVSSVRRAIKRGDVAARRVGRRVLIDLGAMRPKTGEEVAEAARLARGGCHHG